MPSDPKEQAGQPATPTNAVLFSGLKTLRTLPEVEIPILAEDRVVLERLADSFSHLELRPTASELAAMLLNRALKTLTPEDIERALRDASAV